MNRENKKRKYDKKYYKTHPCTDSFTCKICGWPVVPAGAGSNHRNHCPNCLHSIHLDNEPGDPTACTVSIWTMSLATGSHGAMAGWSLSGYGSGKTENGPSSTDV